MTSFLDKLLKNALDFPREGALGIERAHRALGLKPNGQQKPRSIVVKFGSYQMKEEVLRRAWRKKEVFCDNARFCVDHDFPSEVLKKRSEYAEVKKVLKEKQIKFQTPYPAKMRVFYNDGTRLYQDAAEATRDMASQGFSVAVVKSSSAPDQGENRASIYMAAGSRETARPRPFKTQMKDEIKMFLKDRGNRFNYSEGCVKSSCQRKDYFILCS